MTSQKFKQTEIGKIPEDWEVEKLGNIGELKNGVNFNRNDFGKGFPIINVTNLFRGKYATINNLDEIKKETLKNPENYFVKRGDLLFARSSLKHSGTGQAAMVYNLPKNETVFSGFIIRFRLNENSKINDEFLNYLVRSEPYRAHIRRSMDGTTITNINQVFLSNLPVILPSLPEQRAIAKILSDLDAKIELNNKMNKTLETIGQALFKKWFIDNPEREKWEVKKIKDIVADKKYAIVDGPFGTQLHNDEYVDQGIPVIRIINLSFDGHFINQDLVFITEEKFDELRRSAIYPGDILLAKTGATIGKFSVTPNYLKKGVIASSVLKISPMENNRYFLYYIIKNLSDKKYWESVSSGSTRSTINLIDVRDIEIYTPDSGLLTKFETLMKNFFNFIENNNLQNQKLSQIRDALLPKLMNGEIRVN